LRELEQAFGETLFVRLPGKLVPTPRADSFFEALAPMRRAAGDALSVLQAKYGSVHGVVRVTVVPAYVNGVVPNILGELLNEQPELEIELSVSNRIENLVRRESDIAVRLKRPEQEALVAQKVGETEMGLFAHERFIARFGEPRMSAIHLSGFLTGFDRETVDVVAAIRRPNAAPPPRFRFRSDSMMARQAVVESGAGVGMYFVDLAAAVPGLKRVLADEVALRQEVWLCAHDELKRSARMRYVWDRLADALSSRFHALSGMTSSGEHIQS
jgi:DNA-binding transcriptional LysR family regulator